METIEYGSPSERLVQNLHDAKRLLKLVRKYKELKSHSGASKWFVPDTPYSYQHCKKHYAFFKAGALYPERLFMAGNRVGKSISGAFESSLHATGLYPEWWPGKKFTRPTNGWACGDTSQTVRDTVQKELLGPPGAIGTGMIPKERILRIHTKKGIPNAIEMVEVLHESGGVSIITFKSYEQDRKAFQGTAQDWIWLDEECPELVYSEALIRTMVLEGRSEVGIMYVTFTPLSGVTPFIVNFMKNATLLEGARSITTFNADEITDTESPYQLTNKMDLFESKVKNADGSEISGRAVIQAGWADAPWLGEEVRARMEANCPPHLLEARMHGYPSIGSGNVYPIPFEDIVCNPFEIPAHWKHMYALDVGYNRTAALWAAVNPEDNSVYIYSELYIAEARPEIVAAAIKHRGEWIRGVIDPASNGHSATDGRKLIDIYKKLGLKITEAKNEVESGIYNTWGALSTGKLKVFKTLQNFQKEYVLYSRDLKGEIIKQNDHLMDDMRYIMNNIHVAMQRPHDNRYGHLEGAKGGAGKRYFN